MTLFRISAEIMRDDKLTDIQFTIYSRFITRVSNVGETAIIRLWWLISEQTLA